MKTRRNEKQEKKLVELVSANKHLFEGKCRRKVINPFWDNVAIVLNRLGPPKKDAATWKKRWRNWKSCINKKVTYNREAIESGLNCKMLPIKPVEKEIIKMTGMDMASGSEKILCASDTLDIPIVSIQKENTHCEPKNMEKSEEVPRKTTDALQEVPRKTRNALREVPRKTIDALQEVPRKTIDALQEVPTKTIEALQEVPRKTIEALQEVPRKTIDALPEVSCSTMQNQNPESSVRGEELFCEYLCCELKKITLEDTLDDLKLHILQLVRNTIKEEKRILQLQQH